MHKLVKALLAIFFVLSITSAFSRIIYKSQKEVIISGVVYFVVLDTLYSNGQNFSFRLSFSTICGKNDTYSNYEDLSTAFFFDKRYSGQLNNNISQSQSFPTRLNLDTRAVFNLGLKNYLTCFPTFLNNTIRLLLFTGKNEENIEILFEPVESELFDLQSDNIEPQHYKDIEYFKEQYEQIVQFRDKRPPTEDDLNDFLKRAKQYVNFNPTVAINIDDKNFPENSTLEQYLKQSTEFTLKVNMDFYMEILRFQVNSFQYNKRDITEILEKYDRGFLQYKNNEFVLQRKIQSCINILKEAVKKINLGNIFYKDIEVNLNKYDFQTQSFTLFRRESWKDDFYSTMKLFGESSVFELRRGVNIYLSNWNTFSELKINNKEAEDLLSKLGSGNRKMKVRIYFLIQPFPCFDFYGSFQGVIAYGLKGELFKNCITDDKIQISNEGIKKIVQQNANRCYSRALNFLNYSTNDTKTDKYFYVSNNELANGAINLAKWSNDHPENCETGNFLMNAKFEKSSNNPEERTMVFYIHTNYYYVMRPGFEVKFSNSNGLDFPLVVKNVFQHGGMEGNPSTLQIYVKVTRKTVQQMLNAKINLVQIQISGEPKYGVSGEPSYNWDKTIKSGVNILGASYPPNSQGYSEIINTFLKSGL